MSLLGKWFKRKTASQNDEANPTHPQPTTTPANQNQLNRAENLATIEDPKIFAQYIFNDLIQKVMTDEEARSLCASPEDAERLQITEDEQQAAAREYILMFALGPCIFTGQYLDSEYHKIFTSEIATLVSKRLFGSHIDARVNEICNALESYLEIITDRMNKDRLGELFPALYFSRVYPSKLPDWNIALVGFETAMSAFHAARDLYYKLKTNITYDERCLINKTVDDITAEKPNVADGLQPSTQ